MVGVRMRLAFDDFGNDDEIRKRRSADGFDGLDLKAGAREFLREVLRVYVVDLYVFVKPTSWATGCSCAAGCSWATGCSCAADCS